MEQLRETGRRCWKEKKEDFRLQLEADDLCQLSVKSSLAIFYNMLYFNFRIGKNFSLEITQGISRGAEGDICAAGPDMHSVTEAVGLYIYRVAGEERIQKNLLK